MSPFSCDPNRPEASCLSVRLPSCPLRARWSTVAHKQVLTGWAEVLPVLANGCGLDTRVTSLKNKTAVIAVICEEASRQLNSSSSFAFTSSLAHNKHLRHCMESKQHCSVVVVELLSLAVGFFFYPFQAALMSEGVLIEAPKIDTLSSGCKCLTKSSFDYVAVLISMGGGSQNIYFWFVRDIIFRMRNYIFLHCVWKSLFPKSQIPLCHPPKT